MPALALLSHRFIALGLPFDSRWMTRIHAATWYAEASKPLAFKAWITYGRQRCTPDPPGLAIESSIFLSSFLIQSPIPLYACLKMPTPKSPNAFTGDELTIPFMLLLIRSVTCLTGLAIQSTIASNLSPIHLLTSSALSTTHELASLTPSQTLPIIPPLAKPGMPYMLAMVLLSFPLYTRSPVSNGKMAFFLSV